MNDLVKLRDICFLVFALAIIPLFNIFTDLLSSIAFLLLSERIIIFHHIISKFIWNLGNLAHKESWHLLLHDVVQDELVDVYEEVSSLLTIRGPAKWFLHDSLFDFRCHIYVRKPPPFTHLSVEYEWIVMTAFCGAIVNQNCVQIVRDVAVVCKGICYASFKLRYPVLYLLFSPYHGVLVGLYYLNCSCLLIRSQVDSFHICPWVSLFRIFRFFYYSPLPVGLLSEKEFLCLLEVVQYLVLVACLKLLPQLLDFLFHPLGLLENALDPSNICLQVLINKDPLFKFESFKRFFEFLCLLVILHTI